MSYNVVAFLLCNNMLLWLEALSSGSVEMKSKHEETYSPNKSIIIIFCNIIGMLLSAAVAAAAPSLFNDDGISYKQKIALSAYSYSLNQSLLENLFSTDVEAMKLSIGDLKVDFYATGHIRRDKNVTWTGKDSTGSVKIILTVGKDHLFGKVTNNAATYTIIPDHSTGRVKVLRLNPAYAAPLINDFVVAPQPKNKEQLPVQPKGADDGSQIDVMVLYTNGMQEEFPGSSIITRIQYLIDLTNTAFTNSKINTQLRLVYTKMVNYPDDSPGDMYEALIDVTENNGVFANVESLRTKYGADQVTLLRRFKDEGCGLAWVITRKNSAQYSYAMSHDGWNDEETAYCTDSVYAHELGHNLGSAHARNDPLPGRFPYSHGFQDPAFQFRTIMAYPCVGGYCPEITHFSNPNVFNGGKSTGVVHTAADSADNAKTFNQTCKEMAGYRAAVDPPKPPPADNIPLQSINHLLLKEEDR